MPFNKHQFGLKPINNYSTIANVRMSSNSVTGESNYGRAEDSNYGSGQRENTRSMQQRTEGSVESYLSASVGSRAMTKYVRQRKQASFMTPPFIDTDMMNALRDH